MTKIRGMEVVISDEEKRKIQEAVGDICDSSYFMWGKYQEQLQEQFKLMTGKKYAVTFNSCTSALELLFRWLSQDLAGKSRVVFQANTFPSPVYAAMRAGLEVGWVDIDVCEMVPTISKLTASYAKNSFEILVLQWTGGFIPSGANAIKEWCREKNVYFVEDASHASGSMESGRYAGAFGDTAVFSLAATKPLQTGQGGVLVTDNADLADFAFRMKNYGRTEMFQKGIFVHLGFNMHMTEIQAAIGTVLFDSMAARIKERYEMAKSYWPYIYEAGCLPLGNWDAHPNFYKLPILLRDKNKYQLKEKFMKEDIEIGSSLYDFVTPYLPVFKGLYEAEKFPDCLTYTDRHICLPLHNKMGPRQVKMVGERLVKFNKELYGK